MSDDPTKLGPGEEWDATKDATKEAAKQGVDMGEVEGTGPGGTVTKTDVTDHVAAEKKTAKAVKAPKPKAAKKTAKVETDAQIDKVQETAQKERVPVFPARVDTPAYAAGMTSEAPPTPKRAAKAQDDEKAAKAKADQDKKAQAALEKLESEPISGMRLGRIATPPAMLKKNLKLARYMPEILPATPALPLDVSDGVHDWPVYLNDRLGDCACAAPAHMEETFASDTGKMRIPTDADVLALYELQGYNPADPSTDQGSSMGNVLIDWRTQWSASGIYAYCQVDQTNEDHVKLSLWLFRGLYIGIALPLTAQGQAIWDVVPDMPGRNEPGSWGGHAVNVVAINADSSRDVITWGQRIKMTKAFWDTYVDEVYAVVTQDLKAGDKLAVNGFDVAQLEADMAEIGSA